MKCLGLHILRRVLTLYLLTSALAAAQRPADEEAAWTQARTQSEPSDRVAALRNFLAHFPAGTRVAVARRLLLTTLLASFPERTAAIHDVAAAELQTATSAGERWSREAQLALELTAAGETGADLPDATLWAQDALQHLTLPAYRRELTQAAARYHLPSPTPRQVHAQFVQDRALALAAVAAVDLSRHAPAAARAHLDEALRLDPASSVPFRLQGESLAATQQPEAALQTFLHAEALGPLPPRDRALEEQLFARQHPGDARTLQADLEAQIDREYRQLFPLPFVLPRRAPITGGHPALLELFTGSDCLPCTGADLAVDSLLHTYGPSELIALSFDEHIPLPDPLATPETVARAETYGVASTPSAFLDGEPLEIVGSTRADVENIVVAFADTLEGQAALPSGLALVLTPKLSETGLLSAALTLARVSAVPAATTGDASLQALGHAVLHVALVQDDMRYNGRNGVRFHRRVVRSLKTLPATTALTSTATLSFDLGVVEGQHAAYLRRYTAENGLPVPFRQLDFPFDRSALSLVAWVQNTANHHVLQSTFVPVPSRGAGVPAE